MSSSVSSNTATSLIFRLQKNDADAWQQFVELYAPLIFHWCQQLRLDAQDGADIMQEVFAVAAQAIGRYQKRHNGTFRGWLWTITQNKIRDHYRKNADRTQAVGGTQAKWNLDQFADDSPLSRDTDPATRQEIKLLLHRAMNLIKNDFEPQTWTAFWRATVDGHDTGWIAEDLGISRNSVRQAKCRVLRRLREQLGDL